MENLHIYFAQIYYFINDLPMSNVEYDIHIYIRRRKLLDDVKDRRGYSHLKEEAVDRTMWRHRFGGGVGPVVRQNTE